MVCFCEHGNEHSCSIEGSGLLCIRHCVVRECKNEFIRERNRVLFYLLHSGYFKNTTILLVRLKVLRAVKMTIVSPAL
jgi:hypothetical protein